MSANTKKYTFLGHEIGRIGWWGSLLAFLTIPAVTLPYILWFFVRNDRSLSHDPEHWAQFGDYLAGTAGPIIGFASVMVLIATLHSQQSELSEQRRQASRQAFEQTFFTWLNSYRSAVNQFQFMPTHHQNATSKFGVEALHWMLSDARTIGPLEFDVLYKDFSLEAKETQRKSEQKETLEWWSKVFNASEPQLGSLVRSLYTLIRWVDRNPDLSTQDKWDYVAIVRAQLSSPELRMLFFNGYTPAGAPFTEYINRYALLDNLPLNTHSEVKWAISAKTHPFSKTSFDSDLARDELGLTLT